MDQANVDTSIAIDAPPARVWRILIDLRAYPEWNRFLAIPEGECQLGREVNVRARLYQRFVLPFRARFVEVDPPRRLRWVGGLPIPGLFQGNHGFEIEPDGAGGSLLRQYEDFSGLLVPLIGGWLAGRSKPGFETMNAALKERAEREERGRS